MTRQFNGLVCAGDLRLSNNLVGGDWNSEAGEGSGFNVAVLLECDRYGCGRIYTIGYLKNEYAISPPKIDS